MSQVELVPSSKEIDDVEEASIESFPASDAPASRHGAVVPAEQSAHVDEPDGAAEEDAVHASREGSETLEAEVIASHAGFKEPPTFCEHGEGVPRNVDEANS